MKHSPIRREKTAIRRNDLSLPVKCLIRDGLLSESASVFDYGCGRGRDVRILQERGFQCNGWDPAFSPNTAITRAQVVNLGYVINVIEDTTERAETLKRAWDICDGVMTVAAQITVRGRGTSDVPFADGIVTRLGTFQKYFTQEELRGYIGAQLAVEVVAAAPGVFYAFRDEALRESFLSRRYRRNSSAPRKRASEQRYEEQRAILDTLLDAVAALGRLPAADEFIGSEKVIAEFGSLKRAFSLIRRVTGDTAWETIRHRKIEDLTVYLALARFLRRPPMTKLPPALQRDIRDLFGSYSNACDLADKLLFQAGDASQVDCACRDSTFGKLLPNALYIHRDALTSLSPLLRVYEGCARMYVGEITDANIIKLHRSSGKVSYLAYPEFDLHAHPALLRGVKVALRCREIFCYDYSESDNPPVLHRKETFLRPDDARTVRFSRLTEQEERQGLLDESSTIGTRVGWNQRLKERGFRIQGHRLIRQKNGG